MCFLRSKHFSGVLLFVYVIYYTSTSFSSVAYAALNTSEEIKYIFNGDHNFKGTTVSYAKGTLKSGNFAEGGLLNVNVSLTTVTAPTRKNYISSSSSLNVPKKNTTEILRESFINNNITKYKNSTLYKHSTTKTLLLAKLNGTGSNLFLGVPEVIHINGTSSIKPRKGVYYNKIVPRKGVENDNGANHNSDLCVWLGENECYSSKELNDIDCKCCKDSNALGKTIRQNYPVTCKNCKPVIPEFPDDKHICENICCYKLNKTVSDSNTQDIINKNISFSSKIKFKKENSSGFQKIKELNPNLAIANLTQSPKHKPNITKVPYDAEVVTEILSKTKQKVFVPVIVSLLLLPLIGILVFIVVHKIKEIWDKRYYKRMDFLIDGIYQD